MCTFDLDMRKELSNVSISVGKEKKCSGPSGELDNVDALLKRNNTTKEERISCHLEFYLSNVKKIRPVDNHLFSRGKTASSGICN